MCSPCSQPPGSPGGDSTPVPVTAPLSLPTGFSKCQPASEGCCQVGISVLAEADFLFLLLRSIKGEELLGFSTCLSLPTQLCFLFAFLSASHSGNTAASSVSFLLESSIPRHEQDAEGFGAAISFDKQTPHCSCWGICFSFVQVFDAELHQGLESAFLRWTFVLLSHLGGIQE